MNKQLYKYPEKTIDLMFDKLVKEIEQNDNKNHKHYQTKLQLIMNVKQKIKQSNNIVSIYDTNFYILPLDDYLYIIGTIYHCIDGIEPSLIVPKNNCPNQ